MNEMRKVLVVDSGRRGEEDVLSVELAELGLSSVTTSFEAAPEVLGVINRPSAIFLRPPQTRSAADYAEFAAAADALRQAEGANGIPVIVWDRDAAMRAGGISAILRSEIGPQALSEPEL